MMWQFEDYQLPEIRTVASVIVTFTSSKKAFLWMNEQRLSWSLRKNFRALPFAFYSFTQLGLYVSSNLQLASLRRPYIWIVENQCVITTSTVSNRPTQTSNSPSHDTYERGLPLTTASLFSSCLTVGYQLLAYQPANMHGVHKVFQRLKSLVDKSSFCHSSVSRGIKI